MTKIDKRDRATLFRKRLAQALAKGEISQSALARGIGVDRSTVSQLLTGAGARLPNAQVVGECAAFLMVSADWLLGLSDRPESVADLIASSMTLTEAPRALVDQQIFDWYREALGFKVRHVPAMLPDMLKTRALLEWEYNPHLGRTTEQAIGASEDRLNLMLTNQSDHEFAVPLYEVESLVRAEGYYRGLPGDVRDAQIDRILEIYDQLYPRLRITLFDARRLFSCPVTVFGPLLAVIYVGSYYIAFRDTERVQMLLRHFDRLVREATVSDRDFPAHLDALRASARKS